MTSIHSYRHWLFSPLAIASVKDRLRSNFSPDDASELISIFRDWSSQTPLFDLRNPHCQTLFSIIWEWTSIGAWNFDSRSKLCLIPGSRRWRMDRRYWLVLKRFCICKFPSFIIVKMTGQTNLMDRHWNDCYLLVLLLRYIFKPLRTFNSVVDF